MHNLTTPLTPVLEQLRQRQQSSWSEGERVLLEDILAAETKLDDESLLDLIYAEVLLREEHGETPTLEEYVQRFPTLADSLQRQFAFHGEVSSLSDHLSEDSATGESTIELNRGSGAHRLYAPTQIDRIGSYEIVEEIGRGGMGTVYKARHMQLSSRWAALKVLRFNDMGESDELRRRWTTEGLALAALDHPNIVRMYEWEWTELNGEQTPVVVMEYVVGGSLADRIDGTPLSPREAVRLVQSLADAVAHAHERDILHRDLKPSNILLESKSDASQGSTIGEPTVCPKIADFGLAKRVGDDSGSTRTGAVLGTPSYMSPEQAAGRTREVGPSADVYALGAILYECLTGRAPFKADTILNTLEQVVSMDPVPPSQLQPGIPIDLETICLKCLEKDPQKRYRSAASLAEDLSRYNDGRPIVARRAGFVERSAKWIRRHPAAAALWSISTLSLCVVVSLWVVFTFRLQEEKRNAIAQRDEAQRQRAEAVRQEEIARRQSERAAKLLSSAAASVDEIAVNVRSAKTEEMISGNTGSVLFKLACSYAKTSKSLRAGGDLLLEDRTRLADQYALSAVRLLTCAQQLGFFEKNRPKNRRELETTTDLDSLRERPDFKKFLALVK